MLFGKRKTYKKRTEPKNQGQGLMMALQSYANLIKGDWVWDIDLGVLVWNGQEWITEKDWLKYLKTKKV